MDLIEVLWKQDVDLGFSLEANSEKKEEVKDISEFIYDKVCGLYHYCIFNLSIFANIIQFCYYYIDYNLLLLCFIYQSYNILFMLTSVHSIYELLLLK